MKLILLLISFLITIPCYAGTVERFQDYAVGSEINANNLNGNFNNIINEMNGDLDNLNADTSDGFRFYEVITSLPLAGTRGRLLASDTSVFLDSGTEWNELVSSTGGGGDVTAASNITEHSVVRGDDGAKGIELSTAFISDDGEMTNTSQPAFNADNTGVDQDDITAGSAVTIVLGNERFDQGGNFASNTFTAPVTGNYILCGVISLGNVDQAATKYTLRLATSNENIETHNDPRQFAADIAGEWGFAVSGVADMDANDTVVLSLEQTGGSNQSDVKGGKGRLTGALLN